MSLLAEFQFQFVGRAQNLIGDTVFQLLVGQSVRRPDAEGVRVAE
ncbi:hypothetical protein [Halobellus ordinarius]|nr:hypothetical protein [Halobellus sp. ZY16]